MWKEIDRRFDWDYYVSKMDELLTRQRKVETSPTRVGFGGRRYDIAGVQHPTEFLGETGSPSPDYLANQNTALGTIANNYDLVLREDGIGRILTFPCQSISDAEVYRSYGWGSWRLGLLRHKAATRLGYRRWNDRSLTDSPSRTAKARLLAADAYLVRRAEDYEAFSRAREAQRILFDTWPLTFPEHQPNLNDRWRSLVQARYAVALADELGAESILLIVGAAHEPEVTLALPNDRYPLERLLYHIPPKDSESRQSVEGAD